MKDILSEIQDGTFAQEWVAENDAGCGEYKRLMDEDLTHSIEVVGRELRGRMSWLQK